MFGHLLGIAVTITCAGRTDAGVHARGQVAHLDVVDSVRFSPIVPVRVAIDVDAGLLVGGQHVGPKRSPLGDASAVGGTAGADCLPAAGCRAGRAGTMGRATVQ